jgi:hypothetical protein
MVISPNTYFTITQLVKITRVWASNKVRKANDSGLLGEIVNVAGMHSLDVLLLRYSRTNKI